MIRTRANAVNTIQDRARDASVAVATAVVAVFDRGHWSPAHPLATAAQQAALRILQLEAGMGPLGDPTCIEDTVALMAHTAHELIVVARGAAEACLALIDEENALVSYEIEDSLVPAFSLMIVAA